VPRLFDAYLAVDWSARSTPSPARPSPDAIWVAETVIGGSGRATSGETYWRTRRACRDFLHRRLAEHVEAGRRVFVGFDFAYGYPSGFASSLGLNGEDPPWKLMWRELSRLIVDGPDNRNNRFAVAAELNRRCGAPAPGPLWGCPSARRTDTLETTSPRPGYPYPVGRGRAVDRWRWADRRQSGIQPVWKLMGSGSVGGQSLVGIPTLTYLRFEPSLAPVSRVWPFETGFTGTPAPEKGPFVVHAEIWPSNVPYAGDPTIAVKDQGQVRTVTRWLYEADVNGLLADLFDVPPQLPGDGVSAAVREEGRIIGGGPGMRRANAQRNVLGDASAKPTGRRALLRCAAVER
jgi:hypothetical protein